MSNPPPVLSFYRGYDPRSPNLVGPLPSHGVCFGPYVPEGALTWFDSKLQPKPGDVILVGLPFEGRVDLYTKQLAVVDGQPYLVCEDGVMPFGSEGMFFGTRVAMMVIPGWVPQSIRALPQRRTPESFKRELAIRYYDVVERLLRRTA